MGRLTTVLIAVLLLGGCSEVEPPAVPVSVLPDTSAVENLPSANPLSSESDKRLIVVADPWCPHNCKAGDTREGYMVDVAREAMAAAGYTLDYRNLSWARALKMTREGEFHAVVGAFRTDAPDFIFPEVAQGRSSMSLFTHPDNDWTYDGIASLRDQKLLTINGYSYSAELDDYIDRNQDNRERIWILSGPAPLKRALSLLEQNRTDVFAEDDDVMAWAALNDPDIDLPRSAGRVGQTLSYLAFSPARENSAELARILSEGTQRLIENGRMKAILDRYGLSDLPGQP